MAFQIGWFPVLVIVEIIVFLAVFLTTKSLKKTGYALEIPLALMVIIAATMLQDSNLIYLFVLLSIGLLINGIASLLKK
ncbi:MAG: hypothetical protein ABIH65_02100 [Nanoarchaeota archaeon]